MNDTEIALKLSKYCHDHCDNVPHDIGLKLLERVDGDGCLNQVNEQVSALIVAFVQGAKWWEYYKTEFTMWPSDRRLAEEEALKRKENGTLGKLQIRE